jgi:NADH-quinone oxidoreductase subunit N
MSELISNISSLIFLFSSAVVLLILISFSTNGRFIKILSILILLVSAIYEFVSLAGGRQEYIGHMVTINPITSVSTVILYIIGIFTIILMDSFKGNLVEERGDSAIVTLFGICGMQIMIISSEIILMLIGLEIASMSLFVLSARNNRSRLAIEGTIKYLIFSSVFFSIALMGVGLIYGFMLSIGVKTDMLSFHNLGFVGNVINSSNIPMIIAFIFIASLILLKLGIVPYHMWMPDFYEGSPSPVTAFASTSIKVSSVIVLFNILSKLFYKPLISDFHITYKFLEVVTIITIVISTLIALHQTNSKRLLAYSSIANAAIIMLGILSLVVCPVENRTAVLVNILFYLIMYSLMNIVAFGITSRLERGGGENQLISSFGGLFYKSPFLAISLSVALFSLAGLPPSGGFFGKLFIFKSAIDSGIIVTSVIAIVMTIVSLYYYLNFLLVMFTRESPNENNYEGSNLFNISIGIAVILIILLGFFPNLLLEPLTNILLNR